MHASSAVKENNALTWRALTTKLAPGGGGCAGRERRGNRIIKIEEGRILQSKDMIRI